MIEQKVYVEDTIEAPTFTSLNRAFGLQPVMKSKKSNDIDYEMNQYNNQTEELKNSNYSFNF